MDNDLETKIRKLRLLIVDDSRFARSLVKSAVQNYGMRDIIETDCAVEALQILGTDEFDLMLVDYEMPIMTGAELARRVREGRDVPDPTIPIILISGYTDEHRVREARAAGIHEFLAKPFTPADLYNRIRAAIEDERPFIRTETYIGPDRRWVNKGPKPGERERREKS